MTTHEPILSARVISRTYRMGRVDVPVLKKVDIEIAAGEFVAVLGASGSGKSTLLHLLGGLDRPDRNNNKNNGVFFEGAPLANRSQGELNRYRNESVGFVFQFYHLLPELSVLENVTLGAMIRYGRLGYRSRRDELHQTAHDLLDSLGLSHRLKHKATSLSGGERQRVAIARALINHPPLLLADEPTGNLDRPTGRRILDAMLDLRRQLSQTIVMVTHDPDIAAQADRTVHLVDGSLVEPAAVE